MDIRKLHAGMTFRTVFGILEILEVELAGYGEYVIGELNGHVDFVVFSELGENDLIGEYRNEERVFDGHGLDVFRESLGRSGVVIEFAALFAVYHGLYTRQITQHSCHWFSSGLDLQQVAVFGPYDGSPSIHPLDTHGQSEWVGEMGLPELGWLTVIVLGLFAAWMNLRFWRHCNR